MEKLATELFEAYAKIREGQRITNDEPLDWDEVDELIELFKVAVNEYEGNK